MPRLPARSTVVQRADLPRAGRLCPWGVGRVVHLLRDVWAGTAEPREENRKLRKIRWQGLRRRGVDADPRVRHRL